MGEWEWWRRLEDGGGGLVVAGCGGRGSNLDWEPLLCDMAGIWW